MNKRKDIKRDFAERVTKGMTDGELIYFVRTFGDNEYIDLAQKEMKRRGLDTTPCGVIQ